MALDIPSLFHTHFPQRTVQVLYVRLMNSFAAVSLDQLDDTTKTGLHVERQRFEFVPNAIVERDNPSHPLELHDLCNIAGMDARATLVPSWGALNLFRTKTKMGGEK